MSLNPFKYIQRMRDWRLVSTLNAYYTWTDRKDQKETIFYYLYENGNGKRKCTHESTDRVSGDAEWCIKERETHPHYLSKIRPWLAGGFDPDIPSYESIKAKEFKDKLAGRKT